jgi:AmmeMemoRadiSam system protein B
MDIRPADFAGSWYPGSAGQCEEQIKEFLQDSDIQPPAERTFSGGIVPHAGWFYSGSIAANVIHYLSQKDRVDLIIIFGMHLPSHAPNFIMSTGAWETPFGEIPVAERLAVELAKKFSFTLETPERFNPDNTIELQLPFIKYFFENTKIVALGVPPSRSSLDIGRSVIGLAKEMDLTAKVIGSTDLTHYGSNYGFNSTGQGKRAVDWVRS